MTLQIPVAEGRSGFRGLAPACQGDFREKGAFQRPRFY